MSVQLGTIRYYTENDPYHYVIDNQPIQDLEQNDIAIKAVVDNILTTLANSLVSKVFVDGVDYVSGTSTSLPLPQTPPSSAGVWVFFSGVYQNTNSYQILSNSVLFQSPIPLGTSTVEVKWTNIGIPTPGTTIQPVSGVLRDSLGRVTNYMEGSTVFTISYNANGTVNTIVGGGNTQTVTYDASWNVTGVAVS